MAVAQEPGISEVFGIARKMALELEALPEESHQMIAGMLAQGFQHRMAKIQRVEQEKAAAQQLEASKRAEARAKQDSEAHELLKQHREQLLVGKAATQQVMEPIAQ
jgi:hypothetical protein